MALERIRGYKTPAEYLLFNAGRFPGAMAVVMLPLDYEQSKDALYPLVIAFGGAGECAKPPREGALAWLHYYRTDEAVAALSSGALSQKDFRGLVTESQLGRFNSDLREHPFKGVILVCPASPPLFGSDRGERPDFEAFVMEDLLPELLSRYRVAPGKIGVDGVSMGGSRSMYYGFKYPEVFACSGSIQGAFGPFMDVYKDLITRNRDSLKRQYIQLVTSDRDVMEHSVERLHRLLDSEKIPHRYLRLTGPHDYIFNQGPGALALLAFHDHSMRSGLKGPVK